MVDLIGQIAKTADEPYFLDGIIPAEAIQKDISKNIGNENRRIYVAKESDEIVGFIFGEITNCFYPYSKIKKIGYIFSAYVKPSQRRKGILTALEDNIRSFFKENDIKFVELHTLAKNPVAVRSWEKLGYETFRLQMRKQI